MHGLDTFIAKYFILISIITALFVWYRLPRAKKQSYIITAFVGAILAEVLAKIAGAMFYNPRPFVQGHFQPYFAHGNDNGFPSDHTLLAAYLALLVWRYDKKLGYGLGVIALLIGLSRVIAGVHHVVDIIGSVIIAALAVYLAGLIVHKLWHQKGTKNAVETE